MNFFIFAVANHGLQPGETNAENPQGPTLSESPDGYFTDAEYHSHRPWCKARTGRTVCPEKCTCDAPKAVAHAETPPPAPLKYRDRLLAAARIYAVTDDEMELLTAVDQIMDEIREDTRARRQHEDEIRS